MTTLAEWGGVALSLLNGWFFEVLRDLEFIFDFKSFFDFGVVMKTFESLFSGTRSSVLNMLGFKQGSIM